MKERKDKQPIWLENRPNRNVKSLDQSSEDGFDVGDGGKFVSELEQHIDNDLFLKQLTGKQALIAQMLFNGFKQVEISKKLGVTHQAVNDMVKRIRKTLLFL
jgi:DNA-binding NarL/FixJ family response regulator